MFLKDYQLRQFGFKSVGANVLISDKADIYGADKITIQSNVRIDSGAILSAGEGGIEIGNYCHIATQATLIGKGKIVLEDFVGISGGAKIYSSTDDFSGNYLTGVTIPDEFKNVIHGDVILKRHTVIGAGSIVFPNVTIGVNCAIGCMSMVNYSLEPNGIYVGVPVKRIKDRSKNIFELEKKLKGDWSL